MKFARNSTTEKSVGSLSKEEKSEKMIAKRSALTVVPLIILMLLIGLSNLRGEAKDQKPQLVGSWDITICASDPCTQTPFRILRTFTQGEAALDAYSFPSLVSNPGQDPGITNQCIPWFLKDPNKPLINSGGRGSWIKTGPRQFVVTVQYFQLNPNPSLNEQAPNPNLDSIGKVREVIDVGETFDTYTSTFETEISDSNGNVLCINRGTTEGNRITVE